MTNTTAPTVEYGDTVRVGRRDYGWGVEGRWAVVNGETFVEVNNTLYVPCGDCDRGVSGTKAVYSGLHAGVCYGCNGRGTRKNVGSPENAARLARRRATDRARRERKAAAEDAAQAARRDEWATAHPDLAASLATIRGALTQEASAADYSIVDEYGDLLVSLATQAGYKGLSEKQTPLAERLLTEHAEKSAAEAERRAGQRHAGEVKGKVTVTGRVVVRRYCEPYAYGSAGTLFIIIEGTGDDEGVTVKMNSGAECVWDLAEGQTVTVTGTVKAHDEYQGTPQTVLTRPKVTTEQ